MVHEARTSALQVRPGHDDRRRDDPQRVDEALEVELLIRVDAARGADGRHAGREEEARIAHAHELHAAVVHVVVQPDDPGDHGLPGEIDRARACRDGHRARRPDGGDLLAADDDRLPVLHRRAGAVDDARVRERDDRLVDGHVRLERRARAHAPERGAETARQTMEEHDSSERSHSEPSECVCERAHFRDVASSA